MTEQTEVKKAGWTKKALLVAGVYIGLWICTAMIGAPQVRNKVELWKQGGATGVTGNLKIASVRVWSPCPFVVIAQKASVGVVLNPYEGSTSTRYVQKRWFLWMLAPFEL